MASLISLVLLIYMNYATAGGICVDVGMRMSILSSKRYYTACDLVHVLSTES